MLTVPAAYFYIRNMLSDINRTEVDSSLLCNLLNKAIAQVGDELIALKSPDALVEYVVTIINGKGTLPSDFKVLAANVPARVLGQNIYPYDSSTTQFKVVYYRRPYSVSPEEIVKSDEPMPFNDDALNYKAATLAYIDAMNVLEENVTQDVSLEQRASQGSTAATAQKP